MTIFVYGTLDNLPSNNCNYKKQTFLFNGTYSHYYSHSISNVLKTDLKTQCDFHISPDISYENKHQKTYDSNKHNNILIKTTTKEFMSHQHRYVLIHILASGQILMSINVHWIGNNNSGYIMHSRSIHN